MSSFGGASWYSKAILRDSMLMQCRNGYQLWGQISRCAAVLLFDFLAEQHL